MSTATTRAFGQGATDAYLFEVDAWAGVIDVYLKEMRAWLNSAETYLKEMRAWLNSAETYLKEMRAWLGSADASLAAQFAQEPPSAVMPTHAASPVEALQTVAPPAQRTPQRGGVPPHVATPLAGTAHGVHCIPQRLG
ncbi:MAG: hypothetical protein M3O50_10775 [Myxococcota bacterium]|nr:hypothetical protein [Myxococcota bacterium]